MLQGNVGQHSFLSAASNSPPSPEKYDLLEAEWVVSVEQEPHFCSFYQLLMAIQTCEEIAPRTQRAALNFQKYFY